jgi:hypothetical protein
MIIIKWNMSNKAKDKIKRTKIVEERYKVNNIKKMNI